MAYPQEQHMDVLSWPAKSPDLSPIEHAWDVLHRRVSCPSPATLAELKRYLQQEWNAIPQIQIQRLIESRRRLCVAVRDSSTLYCE